MCQHTQLTSLHVNFPVTGHDYSAVTSATPSVGFCVMNFVHSYCIPILPFSVPVTLRIPSNRLGLVIASQRREQTLIGRACDALTFKVPSQED